MTDLDCLIAQLHDKVSSKWYELGVNLRVPEEFLHSLRENDEKECLVEVLDYWLRYTDMPNQPTWKEIAQVVHEVGNVQLVRDNSAATVAVYDVVGKKCYDVIIEFIIIITNSHLLSGPQLLDNKINIEDDVTLEPDIYDNV